MIINRLSKMNSVSRNLLSASLVIIMVVGLFNQIVWPHFNYLYAAQDFELISGNIGDQRTSLLNIYHGKSKEFERLTKDFTNLYEKLFTPEEIKEYYSELQSLAHASGCEVSSMNFGRQQQEGLVLKQGNKNLKIIARPVMLGLTGSYGSLITLLESFQDQEKLVWIDSFDMTLLNAAKGTLGCTISLTAYTIEDQE